MFIQGIEDSGEFVKQYFADLVFYLTLNFIGFYFRYVGEVESTQDIVSSASCEKHQSLADQHAEGLPGQAQLHRDHLQAQVREGAGGQSVTLELDSNNLDPMTEDHKILLPTCQHVGSQKIAKSHDSAFPSLTRKLGRRTLPREFCQNPETFGRLTLVSATFDRGSTAVHVGQLP